MMRRCSIALLLVTALAPAIGPRAMATTDTLAAVGAPPIRALYVAGPGVGMRSAAGCLEMAERARRTHVTDVFIEAQACGFAWYKSDLAPSYRAPGGEFFDALQTLLVESRRQQAGAFRVHVVLKPLLALDPRYPYEPPADHVSRLHPEWLCRDAQGQRRDDEGALWLDPARPEVAIYCAALVTELLERYEVDGVCLGDLRYPGTEMAWGYGPDSLARFREETNYPSDKIPRADEAEWMRWRAQRVSDVAVAMAEAARRAKNAPSVVSIAAMGQGPAPGALADTPPDFKTALQYWPMWCEQGLADWLVIENFHAHHSRRDTYVGWIDYARSVRGSTRLVVSVSGAHNFDSGVAMQMRLALGRGVDGLMLHSYHRPALNTSPAADILAYIGKTIYSPDYSLPAYFRQALLESAPPRQDYPDILETADLPQPVPIQPRRIDAPGKKPTPAPLSPTDATRALLGDLSPQKRTALQEHEASRPARVEDFGPLPPEPDLDFLGGPWLRVRMAHGIEFEARLIELGPTSVRFYTRRRGVELTIPRSVVESMRPAE